MLRADPCLGLGLLFFVVALCFGLRYGLWFGLCCAELPQEREDLLGWPGFALVVTRSHRPLVAFNLLKLGKVVQLGVDPPCGHHFGVVRVHCHRPTPVGSAVMRASALG